MDKKEIINELKTLCQKDNLIIDSEILESSRYKPINEYITNLTINVKPETAASELIRFLLNDLVGGHVGSEVNYERSFIDFVIREKGVNNPICIELKPLFKFDKKKNTLHQLNFKYQPHINQIQKYLRHKQVEYVVLTNINKAFIFNRNALINFEPLIELNLSEIFDKFLNYDSLWDTVRSYEDEQTLLELDNEFFVDLKKWYEEFANVKFNNHSNISKDEMVVLLLNKFIFIKTLEDFGLVPYRFIQDEYERYVFKWVAKGYKVVFEHFFREIESFFEMYYDTELFKSNFWKFIEYSDSNINKFRHVFELILGLDSWSQTFGKGLVHYNYRMIDEDIFGKAYETWIAENRKDEGIFYTPSTITKFMANKIVDVLFDEPINRLIEELKKSDPDKILIDELVKDIQSIKIIDSTSGSGSFLIKVLKAIYKKYLLIEEATRWAKQFLSDDMFNIPDNIIFGREFRAKMNFDSGSELIFISSLLLNHIFAADKDERAIDTAKTNIWKEAVKLNPRIYNYRRLDSDKIHILPNLEMNFITGDSLTDIDFDKQIEIISNEFKDELLKLFEIRGKYLDNPYNPEILEDTSEIKKIIRTRLLKEQSLFEDSLFFPLEFFFCFFAPDGTPLPKEERGFDGIISNPPWEAIKPVKKEFARIDKGEMDILHFTKWFDKEMVKNEKFKKNWMAYKDFYSNYTDFLYLKYSYQGKGDPNYYKFFIERDFQLIHKKGYFCLLVPSGFQTDAGSKSLRELLIENNKLIELSSFENRGYDNGIEKFKTKLFPEVHPQFKFSIIFSRKIATKNNTFRAKFYLQDPIELDNDKFINYNLKRIKQFSPDNLSIMEFRTEKDYDLCAKIVENKKMVKDLGIHLRRELDMTNDSHLFDSVLNTVAKKSKNTVRLYEGKMIHQFNSKFAEHRYILNEKETRKKLLHKVLFRIKSDNNLNNGDIENINIPNDLLLDYQTYRMVYRAIASSTNERTLISSIVPKNVFIGNSLIHITNAKYKIKNNEIFAENINYSSLVFFMSLFNSLTLNYYIRNKISANLNMFYIYELPIAEASEEDKQKIVELGFSLLYRKSKKKDFEDLKNELDVEIDEREELEEIRADLEIIIAKNLYKLEKSDWEYLTSTFTYGSNSESKKELDEIIRISLEKWDL